MSEPTDETVVQTAAEAAEGLVFARFANSDVTDLDITVGFDDGMLEVDVYLNTVDDAEGDPDEVVQEAVEAAEDAVDDLFA
ncbi:DUF3194 domain-containing protein [Halohasta litorea]|uniref:DUF3194 domain-containing protein n=1 Tax=Halohasta litorea TaxID=869891 RepID=A0ABD6D3M8_9EURY|nr:DUF3194 domain-containing protein [Halohasta litorea]